MLPRYRFSKRPFSEGGFQFMFRLFLLKRWCVILLLPPAVVAAAAAAALSVSHSLV
jgi:hypothetical protein